MTSRQKLSLWLSSISEHGTAIIYARELWFALGIALCIGAAGLGYRWYAHSQEQRAYKVFADCVREYEKAAENTALWSDVEQALTLGYQKHARSSLAPYFLAYKADVLLQQNKHDEAVATLDTMASVLPTSSPVYAPYMTKRALVKMDSVDTQIQKTGLEELTRLANDQQNAHRDRALYYLGLYYWTAQDVKQAQGIWENLIALDSKQDESRSPWAARVSDKMPSKTA
ncbi:MAG: hypothetical protein ACHQVS_04665 [Candidatus Babeliales bacterium]